MAMMGLLFENSKNIQIKPKITTIIVKIGEFSNQSPGRVDFASFVFLLQIAHQNYQWF